MTQTKSCSNFLDDFEEYQPHQEWLLLCAYAFLSNSTDTEYAIEHSPFTWLEKETIEELIPILAMYQGNAFMFLLHEFKVPNIRADYADRKLIKLYRSMLDYYGGIMNTIEKFYEFGFFNEVACINPDASTKFAQIAFDSKDEAAISFAESAIIDFYAKYSYKLPPYKTPGLFDFAITKEEAKMEVLSKLLAFWHRDPKEIWPTPEEDPRQVGNPKSCDKGHNLWLPEANGDLICGTCKYDTDDWEVVMI